MAIDGVTGNGGGSGLEVSTSKNDPFESVDLTDFLKLMITELQNQDPLNPMDNAQIMQQIGQMQSISSNQQLSKTLQGMALGQTLSSATSMLNKFVVAMTDEGKEIGGIVNGVKVDDGIGRLQVGADLVRLANVKAVLGDE